MAAIGAIIWSMLTAGAKQIDPRVAAAVALAILLPLAGYAWGHRDAAEACRASAFADALAGAKHNIETLNDAAADTAVRTTKLVAINGSLQEKVESFEKSIANPVAPAAAGGCRLGDADARRLRELRSVGAAPEPRRR